jgi:hypothetical protein
MGSASMLLASSGMLPDALPTCCNSLRNLPRKIMSSAADWLAVCQPERAECSRSPVVKRYLQGPGTGMTNLPSFSATKFSELLEELPFASFCSTLITSFFVGLRFRQTLPVGPSIGVVAFLTSSGVRLTSSMLAIFPPALPDCIIL